MQKITIFTDGSSLGNPGPGGYGVIVLFHADKTVIELGGREDKTTNNRMEMLAAITALSHLDVTGAQITIYADSSYVINGITKWVHGWEKNNWITAAKQQVLNQDLWQVLFSLTKGLGEKNEVSWHYVKGHAGIPGNERVDVIATSLASGEDVSLFAGSFSDYEKFLNTSIDFLCAPRWDKETIKKTKGREGKAYSYVSLLDGKVEVHPTWADCENRVKGKGGAKYKKVFSKEEEMELIASWRK